MPLKEECSGYLIFATCVNLTLTLRGIISLLLNLKDYSKLAFYVGYKPNQNDQCNSNSEFLGADGRRG